MTLNKIAVIPFAKFHAALLGLVGIAAGLIYAGGGLTLDILISIELLAPDTGGSTGLGYGTVLAFGALVGIPLVFMVVGYMMGVLEATAYNLYMKWHRPIDIDFWR